MAAPPTRCWSGRFLLETVPATRMISVLSSCPAGTVSWTGSILSLFLGRIPYFLPCLAASAFACPTFVTITTMHLKMSNPVKYWDNAHTSQQEGRWTRCRRAKSGLRLYVVITNDRRSGRLQSCLEGST
ncbi:hypothetical protein EDB89DRAFT_1496519 [Lactarius sanguifluus]|nr:hypothetical protein EDB89DRAFT_1496519 [Lactarius sanguifluus]